MNKKSNLILSLESSCDETSVAVIKNGSICLSNVIATQINSHKRFGGVVPEVASRHHIEIITSCIKDAMSKANISFNDLDAVAVTYGPGLVGSLLVGLTAAKSISMAYNLPLIPVNHMAGHIYAARFISPIKFPSLALLVSGGHTELVYLPYENKFQILGETRDDAVGEAFDKVGRILGISYPAGKIIDDLSHRGHDIFNFPRAMIYDDNFDFSFSGLKSSFINKFNDLHQKKIDFNKEDLAASFEASIVDVLSYKTIKALKKYSVKQFILAGGVAANSSLRSQLDSDLSKFSNVQFLKAPLELCGDNAAMIGAAGYMLYKHGIFADLTLNANPSLEFELVNK